MRIFVSYAAERRDIAEQLAFALRNDGHTAFFDRADLPAGGDYNARIRREIQKSELFVYCVSPESVAEGGYARTELRFAEQRFRKAAERIVPVIVAPTPFETIPNFAKSVTVLEPSNVVAEVVDVVAKIASTRGERWRAWLLIGIAMVLCLVATYLWVAPRLEMPWTLASLAMTFVVFAPVAYWYWERLALSGARFFWAAPLTLCVVATVAGALAGEFAPVTVWLLPGTTLMGLIPNAPGASPFTLEVEISGERAQPEPFAESGILVGANATVIGLAKVRGAAAAMELMKSYLVERGVAERFHKAYLQRWHATDPASIDIRVGLRDADPDVRIVNQTESVEAVLHSFGSSPLQLVFVESRQ